MKALQKLTFVFLISCAFIACDTQEPEPPPVDPGGGSTDSTNEAYILGRWQLDSRTTSTYQNDIITGSNVYKPSEFGNTETNYYYSGTEVAYYLQSGTQGVPDEKDTSTYEVNDIYLILNGTNTLNIRKLNSVDLELYSEKVLGTDKTSVLEIYSRL